MDADNPFLVELCWMHDAVDVFLVEGFLCEKPACNVYPCLLYLAFCLFIGDPKASELTKYENKSFGNKVAQAKTNGFREKAQPKSGPRTGVHERAFAHPIIQRRAKTRRNGVNKTTAI